MVSSYIRLLSGLLTSFHLCHSQGNSALVIQQLAQQYSSMRVRLKSPGGTATLTLPEDATIGNLINQISEKSAVAHFDVKYGYPPKPLLLPEDQRSNLLASLNVKLNNETLIVSPKEDASANTGATSDEQALHSASPTESPQKGNESATPVSFSGMNSTVPKLRTKQKPVSLKKKAMAGEVPELPLPEYGATMGKTFAFPLCSQILTATSHASYA